MRITALAVSAVLALATTGALAQQVTKPVGMSGYGTLTATASSAPLSGLTVGPNSPAWKMPLSGVLNTYNAGPGTLYVCPLGGTCSATVGIPLVVGQGLYNANLGGSTVSPTVFTLTTATVVAWW